MIEYCVLGDFETAVGFLFASAPDRSARYYRDALCTLALAAAPSDPYKVGGGSADNVAPPAKSMYVQAAKVVAMNADSMGDRLLGVPLLCSAGELRHPTVSNPELNGLFLQPHLTSLRRSKFPIPRALLVMRAFRVALCGCATV